MIRACPIGGISTHPAARKRRSPRRGERSDCPSPALRERKGPTPKAWEGEGRCDGKHTLTRLAAFAARHPLPRCGRGAYGGSGWTRRAEIGRVRAWHVLFFVF